MAEPQTKRQKSEPEFTLLYWPGLPGRGEHIRLALEATGTPYTDAGNTIGVKEVLSHCQPECLGIDGNPPCFSPPMLKVAGAGKEGKDLLITQTSNILLYLGEKIGLGGEGVDRWYVNELTLAALDLNNEAHDTHHPVATMKYYDDQKESALLKATDFRENRLPKFFGYLERVLKGNDEKGKGLYTVGEGLTYADTTWWQVVDGLLFAFPKELEARKKDGEFPTIFGKFYPGIKEIKAIKEYLASDRRLPYGNGIFRHYPELDRQ